MNQKTLFLNPTSEVSRLICELKKKLVAMMTHMHIPYIYYLCSS